VQGKHEGCRFPKNIFLYDEVFNTSVDKFVEIPALHIANFSLFNTLVLFAPFLCNDCSRTDSLVRCNFQN
jgi:hypothetical protein